MSGLLDWIRAHPFVAPMLAILLVCCVVMLLDVVTRRRERRRQARLARWWQERPHERQHDLDSLTGE
jgi:hypothetical protein